MTPTLFLSTLAVGASVALVAQTFFYEAKIADLKRTHAIATVKAQESHIAALEQAREQTAKHQQNAHKAAVEAAGRVAAADASMRRNRGELDRLRDAIRTRPHVACAMPDDSTSTGLVPTDTIGELFGECGAALAELARASQGHTIDVVKLRDAWPK